MFGIGIIVGWVTHELKRGPTVVIEETTDAGPWGKRPSIDWPRGPDGELWSTVVVSPHNLLYEAEKGRDAEKAAKERALANAMDSARSADTWRKEYERVKRDQAQFMECLKAERRLWAKMTQCRNCGPKCECGIWCTCTKTEWAADCKAVQIPPARILERP